METNTNVRSENMQHFKNIKKFELREALCFGVQKKWGKINIPIRMENEKIYDALDLLAKEHNCKSPMHGDILYLKCEGLSPLQKADLLDQGRCYINVDFECIGVYSKKEKYLVLKVKKLSRADKEVEFEVPADF